MLLVGLVCISAAFVTFASASTVAAAAVSLALLSLGVCVYIICIRYVLIYVCMYVRIYPLCVDTAVRNGLTIVPVILKKHSA